MLGKGISGLAQLFHSSVDAVLQKKDKGVVGIGVDGAVPAMFKYAEDKTHQTSVPLLGNKHVPVTRHITPAKVVDERNPPRLGRRGTENLYL